ncbi:MAG: ATPase domain-containing protein, partial [Candidatus Kryptonium sp.]
SKKHLENGRTDGKTLTETIILPELVKEGNELFYNFTKTFSGEKFSLDFIIAFKKELENARKFEKKRFMLTNIYNILSEFLYVEERKKQEKNINLFLRKLGNIFINYSYESAINFIGDEDEEEEQKEIIVSLDFRDRNLLNATIEKLTSTSSLNNIYSSGFKNFDNRFLNGGFEAGRLYVFAGKPGQGKSALLLNFAYNCALKESDRGSVIT